MEARDNRHNFEVGTSGTCSRSLTNPPLPLRSRAHRYPSDHIPAAGMAHRIVQFTADTFDFVGSVRCTAPEEGAFTGVAVELNDGNQIFTTLPVVPVPEMTSRE